VPCIVASPPTSVAPIRHRSRRPPRAAQSENACSHTTWTLNWGTDGCHWGLDVSEIRDSPRSASGTRRTALEECAGQHHVYYKAGDALGQLVSAVKDGPRRTIGAGARPLGKPVSRELPEAEEGKYIAEQKLSLCFADIARRRATRAYSFI